MVRLRKERIKEFASQLAIDVSMEMLTNLVVNTPVDTSQALSNWQVRLNSPATNVIPPHVTGYRGSTRGESARQAVNAAMIVLQNKNPGQPIWISNNVDYMEDLDNGSSLQQPAGLFARAILKGRIYLNSRR